MTRTFKGNFTQQEPIPDRAIDAALRVLGHGRLHRYNVEDGETSETALLEAEFAAYMGVKYCLAVASGGYALANALRAAGVSAGDEVLSNAFTLAPVPGAIASIGAHPVLVEVAADLTIDLTDLERKIGDSTANVLLLSHMRGHICDMDKLMAICTAHGILVIEDCAHTMGARWSGKLSGCHGAIACFSTQTYKHMNSGEGGLMISNDPDLMARSILLSGSYALFDRHGAAPPAEAFSKFQAETPNISGRMDNLRAAILRPQLENLTDNCAAWNARYEAVETGLRNIPGLKIINRDPKEQFVGSSIQFFLVGLDGANISKFVRGCAEQGVELKWFGAAEPAGFTSKFDNWAYIDTGPMLATQSILANLLDMRIPLTFSLADCAEIAEIIRCQVFLASQEIQEKRDNH